MVDYTSLSCIAMLIIYCVLKILRGEISCFKYSHSLFENLTYGLSRLYLYIEEYNINNSIKRHEFERGQEGTPGRGWEEER